MLKKIENFFLQKLLGKMLARAAVTVAGYIAGPLVQGTARGFGLSLSVDPAQLEAGAIVAAHAIFEYFKAWRSKKNVPAQ